MDREEALLLARLIRVWFDYLNTISKPNQSSDEDIESRLFYADNIKSKAARNTNRSSADFGFIIAEQIEYDLIKLYGEEKILEVCEAGQDEDFHPLDAVFLNTEWLIGQNSFNKNKIVSNELIIETLRKLLNINDEKWNKIQNHIVPTLTNGQNMTE